MKLVLLIIASFVVGAGASNTAEADEAMRVKGVIVEGGIVCPLFRAEDGDTFPLMGVRESDHPIGTRLELDGEFVRRSMCQQGEKTFRVESVISSTAGAQLRIPPQRRSPPA